MKIFTDFSKAFASKAPELDKKNKAVVIANLVNRTIQERFRAIHPAILRVEIGDSNFRCPNHYMPTFKKDHTHTADCSYCVANHSHHQNLCDRLNVIIQSKGVDNKDLDKIQLAMHPLMLEIFDFLPERHQMYETYDRNISDSILLLAYRGSDYVYPGFR
jgi:hypothetical protein